MKTIANYIKSVSTAGLIAGIALAFSGCATPTKSTSMASAKTDFGAKYNESVSVTVAGGSETKSSGKSQISNEALAESIKASIESSALFAKVLGADAADYRLHAEIVRVEQPTMGFNMTVTLEIQWALLRKADTNPVWQKAELTTFTATVGDAFAGVARLRMATEGAAKLNIEQALAEIGQLKL